MDPDLALIPESQEDNTEELKKELKKLKEDELLCHVHILNTLPGRLYDLYIDNQSTPKIWKALEFKFCTKEEDTKKFIILKYFDFKMLNSKLILAQVHELRVLVNKLEVVKIDIPEAFKVGAITVKFTFSWKIYKKKLIHNS